MAGIGLFRLRWKKRKNSMKVEHLTFRGNSVIRDTNDILTETVRHFRTFQVGSVTAKIEKTNLSCKVTVENNIAFFDLLLNNQIICTNLCCFAKEDKEPVMLYLKDLVSKMNEVTGLNTMPRIPKLDQFIYTVIIQPILTPDTMIAGEIELYIYDAIRRGMQKGGK